MVYGGDVGVDAKSVGEAPSAVVLAEASRHGSSWLLAKALLQMCLAEEILVWTTKLSAQPSRADVLAKALSV